MYIIPCQNKVLWSLSRPEKYGQCTLPPKHLSCSLFHYISAYYSLANDRLSQPRILVSCLGLWWHCVFSSDPSTALQPFSKQWERRSSRPQCRYLRWEATTIKFLKSLICQPQQFLWFSSRGCRQHYVLHHVMFLGLRLNSSVQNLNQFWCFSKLSVSFQGTQLQKRSAL